MSDADRLDHLRLEIERVTLSIIDLVCKRNSLAKEVALEKARLASPLIVKNVEDRLRRVVLDRCRSIGVDTDFGLKLLNQLIQESIRLQGGVLHNEPKPDGHEIFTQAKEMESAGKPVIHLEIGEPDFGPPHEVIKAMTDSVKAGFTRYTESAGIPALRERISDYLNCSYKSKISPQELIVTVSGRYAIFLAILSTLRAGEEAIIIDPSFPAYSSCVMEAGGRPIRISTELSKNWTVDMQSLQRYINESTKLIILNSPSNPTGKILDRVMLEALVDFADDTDIRIVSDEVYAPFSYSPFTSLLDFPLGSNIVIRSFSKPYGMTGFRLGYAVSDRETIRKMIRLQQLHLTSAPEFIQWAGVAALDCEDELNRNIATVKSRLDLTMQLLRKLPISFAAPDGGFYFFAKPDNENLDGTVFAKRLLVEKGVCVMPGAIYGSQYQSFFRISVCQPEDKIREGLELIQEVLQ